MKTLVEIMARSVGARPQQNKNCDVEYLLSVEALEQLIELVRADEREIQAEAFQQILAATRNAVRADERARMTEQPQQELPAWWPAVENILNEYGLQAIDFVADFKAAMTEQPAQRKPLTRPQINQMMADAGWQNSAIRQADLDKVEKVARAIEAAHGIKEKNT